MDLRKKDLFNKYILLVDLVSIVLSFILASWIRFGSITNDWADNIYTWSSIFLLLLYITIFYFYDTHSRLIARGFLEELMVVIKTNSILAFTATAVMFLFQEGASYSRLFFLCFFLLNILIMYVCRQYYKILFLTYYKKSTASNKIMIITTADQVREVLLRFQNKNEWDYQVSYLTILDKHLVGQKIEGIEVKADFLDMFEVAKNQALDGIFIHIPGDYALQLDLEETILAFENMGITVNLSINTFGLKLHEKTVQEMSGYHVLTFSSKLFNASQLHIKRLFDITGGLVGCFLTLLIGLFVAPAILIESPGPIFFSQIRVGKNGRRFRIYKFRSMYPDAEERKLELLAQNEMDGYMFKIKDDPRITKVGKFLRKTSLDEFPQFFNILKGDMSLVGTRPPTEDEFLQYEGRHKRRLALKSGLTGLWQVSGRSDIKNFEEVVKMDLDYIDNWSFLLDIKILLKTFWVVLMNRGSR